MRFPAAPIWMALALLVPAIASAQNNPPVADAGESQTIFLGDVAILHGAATDPDGDPIVGWQWDTASAPADSNPVFWDADTPDATFTTDTVGDYIITLVAQDYFAWSDPAFTSVTVVENQPPTAVAAASPASGPAPLVVAFDGTGSFDPEGGSLLYDWTFDDGAYGTGPRPVHEYTTPGAYAVSLKATDDRGNIDFDTVDITVTEPPLVPALSPPSIAVLALLLLGSAAFTLRRVRGEPH